MSGIARSQRGWLAPFAAAVLLGGVVRAAVAWSVFPVTPLGDELYYAETAVHIARGEGHVYGPQRMAARWPPAQAALLAPFVDLELFESAPELLVELAERAPAQMEARDRAFLAPLIAIEVALSALVPGLTALLAWVLFSQRAAFAAGTLAALNPALIASSHTLWSETLFAVLLTAALVAAARWRVRPSAVLALSAGVYFGLAGLTRELALPIAASVGAWWVYCAHGSRRRAAAHAALLGIAAALVVAPWTLRNFERFDRFVPVSTVGWMGLREGNTLSQERLFARDWPAVREFRLRYVAESDEMARMDLARREALELIRAEQPGWLPRKLVFNLGELASPVTDVFFKIRQGAYGDVSPTRVRGLLLGFALFTAALFAAGLCGVFVADDSARRSFPMFVFAPLLLVHTLANAFPKYRLPLEPVLLCYAGAWLTAGGARRLAGRDAKLVGALFLLVLALGVRGFAPQALRLWNRSPEAPAAEAPAAASGPPRPQRIVLISMDTVRADRVGAPEMTPAIARLAAEGASFGNFYAASNYTIPSHMSMFTGLDALEHGVTLDAARLSPSVPTLAELLRDAGYRTRAFHEGAYVDGRFGFARGFEIYRRYPRVEVVRRSLPSVLAWLRARGDERWFLFLHSYAAHFPYGGFERYRTEKPERGLPDAEALAALRARFPGNQPLSRAARRSLPFELRRTCTLYNQLAETHSALLPCGGWVLDDDMLAAPGAEDDLAALLDSYDARIRSIDDAVAALRAELERLGQWEDTLVVVTADHGEAFYEHGLPRHEYVPFDEVLRVPLVISWPRFFGAHGGRRIDGLAWHLDLLPTLTALVGIDAPPGLRGRDLSAVLVGDAVIDPARVVFPAVLEPANKPQLPLRRVARRGAVKRIRGHPAQPEDAGHLFDLARDPQERVDLREERAETVDALDAAIDTWEASLVRRPPVHQNTGLPLVEDEQPAPPLLPQERFEELRQLGYVE
jgi:arylsulfatase A-like enzyme